MTTKRAAADVGGIFVPRQGGGVRCYEKENPPYCHHQTCATSQEKRNRSFAVDDNSITSLGLCFHKKALWREQFFLLLPPTYVGGERRGTRLLRVSLSLFCRHRRSRRRRLCNPWEDERERDSEGLFMILAITTEPPLFQCSSSSSSSGQRRRRRRRALFGKREEEGGWWICSVADGAPESADADGKSCSHFLRVFFP